MPSANGTDACYLRGSHLSFWWIAQGSELHTCPERETCGMDGSTIVTVSGMMETQKCAVNI